MVAPSGRWTTIEIPAVRHTRTQVVGKLVPTRRASAQPQDLLPWADPYIAGLVHKLKAEILAEQIEREERMTSRTRKPLDAVYEAVYDGVLGELTGGVFEELDPPLPSQDPGFEFPDRDSWPNPGEIL